MSKNAARIRAAIRALVSRQPEVVSGTVTAIDTGDLTITVQPSNNSSPIEGVMLNVITGDNNGMVLFPAIGSNVIISTIDGPGEWGLIRASDITKAVITIENVSYEMDGNQVNIQNGNVVLNISDSVLKIKTESESLFQLLKDCFTQLAQLTVSTSSGVSSVPTNAADFTQLIPRLNNLLSA